MKRFMTLTTLLTIMGIVALMGMAQAGGDGKSGDGKCGAAQTAEAGKTCGSGAAVQTTAAGTTCNATAAASFTSAQMHDCCVQSAKADQGCCGVDAARVKAMYSEMRAAEMALATMHECCAKAVQDDKGCCGKDAAALKATYTQAVTDVKAKQVNAAVGCGKSCPAGAAAGSCGDKDANATQAKPASTKSSES